MQHQIESLLLLIFYNWSLQNDKRVYFRQSPGVKFLTMAEKRGDDTVTFAVAFDIGTRTTGYALSHNKNPLLICAGLFDGSHVVERAPTSVLVDEQKQFVAFGVNAEDMYAKLDKKSKSNGWALFKRFKDQINHLAVSKSYFMCILTFHSNLSLFYL